MKPQIKLPLLLAFLFLSAGSLSAQWDSIQLPCAPPYVYNLQTSQGTVYAYNGYDFVYKSVDQGLNWQFAFTAPNFVINPYNNRFYRYTVGNYGVEFSIDQGQTWTWLVENPFLNQGTIAVITFSGDTEYLYANQSLYRVTAQGLYLIPTAIQVNYTQCFVQGQHLWVNSYFAALHSADGGITWDTIVANGPDNYNGISMAATGDTILINYFDEVDSNYVMARTTDQGLHWAYNTMIPFSGSIIGSRPYQGFDFNTKKTYYSWNGLTDWQLLDIVPIPNTIVSTNAGLLVGLQSGVYYGPNGQWQKASFNAGSPCSNTQTEVYLRKTAGFLLFGSENGGFGMATHADGSNAWSINDEPYFAERPVQIGNHLIGCGLYGTYRATLGLPTFKWELINPQGGFLMAMNGLLYVCDPADNAVYRSSDEGQIWIKTGALPEIEASSNGFKSVLGGTDGRLFLRVRTDLLVSEDEGLTWTVRNTFPTFYGGEVSRLFAVNGFVLLSYVPDQQIFFSSDYGVTFSLLPAPKNTVQGQYRLRVQENTLFLYNGDNKLYRSTDWGQTWTPIKPPYPGFNFEWAISGNTSTVYGDQIYLFDVSRNIAWTANPDELVYTPCDNITINMPIVQCGYINVSVYGAEGNLNYAWYQDGVLIQQNDYHYPQFLGVTGSTYTLRITDIDGGCTISDSVRIVPEPVADIKDKSPFLCSQQLDTLDFSGSSNSQGVRYSLNIYDGDVVYSNYFNINGVPVNPNPPAVAPGHYLFWVYDDLAGCSAVDTIFVQHDANLTIASIDLGNASCGQSDGRATVHNTDPDAATYNWSTGGVQPLEIGLAPGWHSVTVTNGFCAEHRNFLIEEDSACSVKIRGRVYNDTSSPDCLPGGAYGASGVMLRLMPDNIYTYTNAQGYYEFARPAGNYSVQLAESSPTELLCPASGSYLLTLPLLGNIAAGNDFYFKTKPVQDIGVSVTAQPAVQGSTQQFVFTIWNHSNIDLANVLVVFKHGEGLTDLNPSYLFPQYDPVSQTGISAPYYLPAGYSQTSYFTMQVPADIPVGTVLHYSMDIFPNVGDISPENNHVEWSQTVVGTLVGNEKTVSPGETEHGGKIFEKDSLLHYTLRFQNNGNYKATTVEIRDTLDQNLDVTSIQVEDSNYSYKLKTSFEGHNVLVFTFENINLNYSAANAAESRAYVTFSIKRKSGLPFGTVIRNRAAVSFDFNKPVITNIVESVLSEPVSTKPDISASTDISIYPNPNSGIFMVELTQTAEPNTIFRIMDPIGRFMLEQKTETGIAKQTIQAGKLPAGLYFLQLVYDGRIVAQKKFVKL